MELTCFKAYDIRGQLGVNLNEEIAYRIGRAYGEVFDAKTVVVGGDARATSPILKQALANGLMDSGVNVIDIGMTGTEEIYFASFYLPVDGGIEVTASHNPIDYNGMKPVGKNAKPISSDSGLLDIKKLAELGQFKQPAQKGSYSKQNILEAYIDHLLTYIDLTALTALKLVVNAGNGSAGHVVDALEARFKSANVPVEFIKLFNEADSTFPNGIPNPMLVENQQPTREAVLAHKADLGIAWDGDFDRCFFFDEEGNFVEGYYVVGLLAEAFLNKQQGAKIIHDPRLTWNTIDICQNLGGEAIQSKTGHAFIKERMRKEDAVYGGEMSGHHYFKQFSYCDSGMIPWLLVIELLCKKQTTLGKLLNERMNSYPCSGEINFRVSEAKEILTKIQEFYAPLKPILDETDGKSLDFGTWRVNIRTSNTEPLLRLNVESKNNPALVAEKVAEITGIIGVEPIDH